ncbi:MAG: hypothetical protein U5R46_01705 [Gammaproteobacteria bacterium]|nr:hypothetical protein [Gammaproteobacteria bacterium]
MTQRETEFLSRLRGALQRAGKPAHSVDQRHPVRDAEQYRELELQAAAEVDAVYERLEREIRTGIADIEKVIGPIAEPMAEQLAQGAVSDVFAAAAEVLKSRIRGGPESPG